MYNLRYVFSIPLIIGVATGAFVVVALTLIFCFVCRCCPAYKKRSSASPSPTPPDKDDEIVRGQFFSVFLCKNNFALEV
jgi:hypothetical protein